LNLSCNNGIISFINKEYLENKYGYNKRKGKFSTA
jgi:hypothetical protein